MGAAPVAQEGAVVDSKVVLEVYLAAADDAGTLLMGVGPTSETLGRAVVAVRLAEDRRREGVEGSARTGELAGAAWLRAV